jgi:hypothetical protein
MVLRRHEEAWHQEFRCGTDQGLKVLITFRDGVREEANRRGVSRNPPQVFDHHRRIGGDRVAKLAATVEAVDLPAQLIASVAVSRRGWSNIVARE